MQIKKYRAATTREALEQIKSELGEEAFVLETKQVRTGGILGFGSGTQVEVSAAAPQVKRQAKEKVAVENSFDLTDDEPATPIFIQNANKFNRPEILPALAVRAAAANSETNDDINKPKFKQLETVKEVVEISTEAPRIIHAKKESPVLTKKSSPSSPTSPVEPAAATNVLETSPSQPQNSLSSEMERLRAEMREVKFTLGAFAAKQSAFASLSDALHEIPGEIYDSPYYEAYLELTSTGMSSKMAGNIVAGMISPDSSNFITSQELAHKALSTVLPQIIRFSDDPSLIQDQTIIAMIGATGVGKTTTLAKLAARIALRERRRVEMVTLDTYRIAAVEQLKTYAEIIGAGCHVVRSVLELDATMSRMPADAVVLIDTTGRSPHDLSDQFEFSDYLRRREDILKCLVLQATTQPLDALAAVQKFAMYGANCLALTKLDETTRPGAVINVAADANLPLFYLCAGQRVPEDLEQATAASLTARVLPKQTIAAAY